MPPSRLRISTLAMALAVGLVPSLASTDALAQTLYPNSIASNDLDFIRPTDPATCFSLTEVGSGRTEIYDPRRDRLFVDGALHFDLIFMAGEVRLNVHPDVGDPQARATQVAAAVSRLPRSMRGSLRYVNILDGDGGAWSEDAGGFFTLYDDLIARRLQEGDLDETVFHETVHVAWDPHLSAHPDWRAAQEADGGFVTDYASAYPEREDLAESALFAWTLDLYPGRLPAQVEAAVRATIPNRIAYLARVLGGSTPQACPT